MAPRGSSTSFYYRIVRSGSYAFLDITGDLKFKDPGSFVEKYERIRDELAEDQVALVGVDLNRATTITSSTLAMLFELYKRHELFYVCVSQPHIRHQLEIIHLQDKLELVADREEALALLSGERSLDNGEDGP